MNAFFTDLLHDLKEKKLWPVAALLLLAVVAAPAMLLKSGGDSAQDVPAVPPAQAGPGTPEAAVVSLAADEPGEASDLDSFDEKNPFGDGGDPPSEAELPPAGESEDDSGAPASGDSPGGSAPASGDSPSSGGGDGGSQGGGDSGDEPSRPVAYTYQVDVRFGRRDGRIRSYRGLERFDVLPRTGEVPVLIFLGVSPTAKTAIFLVDSSVTQEGDGRCKPTKEECTYLQLTTAPGHDLHYLTTESGAPYAIRLTDIRRVRVGTSARSSRRARASARRGGPPAIGADLVVEGR